MSACVEQQNAINVNSNNTECESEIVKFYDRSTVFITGVTGSLGKVFVEKLLRTCYSLNKIYIILRPKKNKEVNERVEAIFDLPLFDLLKKKHPKFMQKVSVLTGDLSLPNLGLSIEDQEKLIREVNVVIHCAANTRFDEHLLKSTNLNVRALRDLIELADKMQNLKSFIHISTAYANCTRKHIDEVLYDPPMKADKLIQLVESVDDDTLEKITPSILKDHPNPYTFTKAIAENLIKEKGSHLPIGIFRPSIVVSTYKEPFAGWVDNIFGPIAASLGIGLGLVRCMPVRKECLNDIVPLDYTINGALAATWEIASKKVANNNQENNVQETDEEPKVDNENDENIPVYNYVTSLESPITSGDFIKLAFKEFSKLPSEMCVWYPFLITARTLFSYNLLSFFLHTIPAHIIDFIATCIGKKPILVKIYKKINKYCNAYAYFSMSEWTFTNNNTQNLWNRLNKVDQDAFCFTLKNIDWPTYFFNSGLGGRIYILKDPIETLKAGERKYFILTCVHYASVTILAYLLYKFISFVVSLFLLYI